MNIFHFLKTFLITFFCLASGALFFAWYNNYLIIMPRTSFTTEQTNKKDKRICQFFFLQNETWLKDSHEIVWSQNPQEACATLIKNWITFCQDEHCHTKRISLQTCMFSDNGTTAFLSFDRNPFTKKDSIATKLAWCESLLKTIHTHFSSLENIVLLVHQQPLKDYHLDFSMPWPITGYTPQKIASKKSTLPCTSHTIMIDPAGDALYTGRIIDDTFERSISLHAAQALKKELENLAPHIKIILTRLPGDSIEPLQNSSFANKLTVDFYISLHFFKQQKNDPSIALYYMLVDPEKDLLFTPQKTIEFIPYKTAHKKNLMLSCHISHLLAYDLTKNHTNTKIYKPCGIPCKALMGISAPAVLCEYGITTKDDWKSSIPTLAQSIARLCNQ